MKFTVFTSKHVYSDRSDIEDLEKLGFTFDKIDYTGFVINKRPEIEINSFEELMELVHNYGKIIVNENFIEIYNDHRE